MIIIPNIAGKKEPVTLKYFSNTMPAANQYQAGDFMIGGLYAAGYTGTITSGWTEFRVNYVGGTYQRWAYRIATGSDPGPMTWGDAQFVMVFGGGKSINITAPYAYNYPTNAYQTFASPLNLQDTSGGSYVLGAGYNISSTQNGFTYIGSYINNLFFKLDNTAVASTPYPSSYDLYPYGVAWQIIEVKNT